MRLQALALLLLLATGAPAAALPLPEAWPEPGGAPGERVEFPSSSPFTPAQAAGAPATTGLGRLFVPEGASPERPVPAVVLLHGSGGAGGREAGYARQLAAMGVAALVVDTYGARPDLADDYVGRILAITESMFAADAFAALDWLARARPEVDPGRVAVAGYSYGGLGSLFAANAGVADRLARGPHRFAAHASYYAPCIGDFADPRTTGAPILVMAGALDRTADRARCREAADEFRRGGSEVRLVVYEGAYHQWDGAPGADWSPSRGIAGCRFRLEADGTVRDVRTGFGVGGRAARMLSLTLCTDRDGYRIKADPAVRARSDAELARFLNGALGGGPAG